MTTTDIFDVTVSEGIGMAQKYALKRALASVGVVPTLLVGAECIVNGTVYGAPLTLDSAGVVPGHYFEATARICSDEETAEAMAIARRSRDDFRASRHISGEELRRRHPF
ncbi:MAG TPA: hypothetical protein VFY71_10305 [Planctomycetota bacterium]|nr:hypothetical protein [Planctomycetota bacterium]